MKRFLLGVVLVLATVTPLVGAVSTSQAGAAEVCHVDKGVRLCASSVQDVQVEIAGLNLSRALGAKGINQTGVRFDAPSLNSCLQVGRLTYKDATKYLGNYICEWIN